MLRYTGNTEALDLGAFDVGDDSERAKRAKRHRARAEENKDPNDTASKRGNWFILIFFAICAVAVFFVYIYGDIELNAINSEIAAVEGRISEATRENRRLTDELDSMATPARVEAFAAENGLVREQVLQITHISVNVESVIEVAPGEEEGDVLSSITAKIDEILAFLGFV
jgi:cell division protein FtsL